MPSKTKNRFFRESSYLRLPTRRAAIICCLIIVLLLGGSWFFRKSDLSKNVFGTAELSDEQLSSLSEKDKYQSLDLRVASLAVYKGAALKTVKDLGSSGGVRTSLISFPVYSANLKEFGLLTLPASAQPPGGYPVVILCHGYVNPARYSTTKFYVSQMQYYSQHGFAVVKPDLRGQGLSKSAGKPEGAYYSMAYNADILSLVASLKQTSYIDKDNISLWGHSMGGYIALRAAVLSPDIKNVILLSAPIGNIEDMYASYTPSSDSSNPAAQLIKNTTLSEHGTPLANPSFWDNTSPLNYLSKTRAYIQIHVGAKDKIVPPKFSVELDSMLTKDGKPHQYYVYQDGTHGLVPQTPQILRRSLDALSGKR